MRNVIPSILFPVFLMFSCIHAVPSSNEENMETKNVKAPVYLYKILSIRHWQASQGRKTIFLSSEDEAFIHFSTEDQLDKIINKYWADVPEFVVLKVETDKLEGRLVYEANPGGTTKYYHLYQGIIPFDAIVESKNIYQHPASNTPQIQQLQIVEIGDPVLREPARVLSKEEIKSPEIQVLIEKMIATLRAAPGVGLAAPQIGRNIQLIVIEDMDHSHLTAEQLKERERDPVPLHVLINPKLYIEKGETTQFFEGCLSIPKLIGVVPRAKSVRVEYLNERGDVMTMNARGWYARILQHEIDHLHGILYIDRALPRTLMTEDNYVRLWKGKSIKEIVEAFGIGEINEIDVS